MSDITQPTPLEPDDTQPVRVPEEQVPIAETQPVDTPARPVGQSGPPINGGDTIIYTKGLSKHFRNEYAVRDLNLNVPPGKIYGFIGPSGSGKTTTIRLLTGFYAPSEGEVFVFDRPPTKFSQSMRAKIGYMPQLFVLYPHLSVWENLNFSSSIYGMKLNRGKRLKEVLDFVELYEHRHKLARNISGGMQRRLSLAATLVHNPELIFLDEPTAGVDPVLRERFWEHFRDLREQGRTLFVTTQYVGEAAYCDLIGVMNEGSLIMVDTPDRLRYKAYGGEVVDLRTVEPIDYLLENRLYHLPDVYRVTQTGENSVRLIVEEASTSMPQIMDLCRDENIAVESMEEYLPPFDDVFVRLVKKERE
ncbi:MAG TPA: ABC transporter ATP-binding protein [Anaerolineales bacterium]